MAGIFETTEQGVAQASPITVKAGVAEEDTFTPFIAELAAEAGMEGMAQTALGEQAQGLEAVQDQRNEELGELRLKTMSDKFDALSVGISQGLPTSQANTRARALLAETKAAVPWIADRADSSFKSFFGGSSGGKGFEMSPQEKAIKEYQENVTGVAATMGVSLSTAQTVVQTKAANDHAEQTLRQGKLSQENNEGSFRNYISSKTQNGSVMVQSIMEQHMQGGNVLDAPGIRSVGASISTMANQMKMDLQREAFDPETKQPLLSTTSFNARVEEIDKWVTDQKALVGDRSYQDLVKAISETKNYETAIASKDIFPVISVINAAGGQLLVQGFLKGVKNPRYVKSLVAQHPQLARFFDEAGKPQQVTAASLALAGGQVGITDPESNVKWARDALRQGGAETSQRFFEDPKNVSVTRTIYNQVNSENPEEAATAKDYHKKVGAISPSETGRTLSSETFKAYAARNPDESFKVVANSVEGMATNFKSAYLDATGEIPDYIEFKAPETKLGVFKATTSNGELIPAEARSTLSHAYSVLKNNPQYVEEYEKILGIPLTAADVMELSINGKVHKKYVDRMRAQEGEGEFKGASRRAVEKQGEKYDNMGAWARAMRLLSGPRDPKKSAPWMFIPEGSGMVDPAVAPVVPPVEETTTTPTLTAEDAQYIKSAPNLTEKVRRAKLMGIPSDMIDKITGTALDIEGRK